MYTASVKRAIEDMRAFSLRQSQLYNMPFVERNGGIYENDIVLSVTQVATTTALSTNSHSSTNLILAVCGMFVTFEPSYMALAPTSLL